MPSQLPIRRFIIKNRKCGVDFDYLREGCGKTYNNDNDTIPHTRIDMEHRSVVDTPRPQSKQEMSAVRCPVVIENFHIFT